MKHTRILAVAIVTALSFAGAFAAHADDVVVSATVTDAAAGRVLAAPLAALLTGEPGSQTMTAEGLLFSVVEAGALGTNWSVKAQMSGSLSDPLAPGNTIGAANLSLSEATNLTVVGGGGTTSAGAGGSLDEERTIMSNTGQNPLSLYFGTYQATAGLTLNIPSGTATGAYTGTMVVTLYQ